MALTNQGTRVSISNQLIPTGFVPPAISTFSDQECVRTLSLNVLKSTVENAAKETTLLNIIKDVAIGIEKQVDDIIAADYIATNTVDYWTDFRVLGSNIPVSKTSDFLNATPVFYIANINIYIKTS